MRRSSFVVVSLVVVSLAVLVPAGRPAWAQTSPDAGSLLRQQEQLQRQAPSSLPAPVPKAKRPPLKQSGGATVRVKAIRFIGGGDLAPESQLQAQVADAVGKELDFAGLQSLAERVTAYLKNQGWFLARAYLPRQDVTAGTVKIAIVAGRLDPKEPVRIVAENPQDLRLSPGRLKAIADSALPPGAPARESAVNRAVLLMNDLPGIAAHARMEPGTQSGETRIVVGVDEGPLYAESLSLDNYGSRDTGEGQLNAGLTLNDPTGRGDLASVGVTASEGIQLGRIGYILPLGSDGWKLSAGYTDMRYEVVTGIGKSSGLKGTSQSSTLGLRYPWLRGRTTNLYLALDGTATHLVDRSSAGTLRDKDLSAASVTLSGDRLDAWGGGGLVNWSAAVTAGQLDFNLAADAASDAASYRTAGGYTRFNYYLSRLQKLHGGFTAFASLTGQEAGKNLDSSEKLYAGGPNGVRAYPGSEGGADSGRILSLELRYDWPQATPLGSLQLQGFYDAAWLTLHHDPRGIAIPTATGENSYQIAGAGFGISLRKAGSHLIRALVASKAGSNPGRSTQGNDADGRAFDTRFWLQTSFAF